MIPLPLGNSALIISKDRPGELLAVHRKEDSTLVCFPGGKQEAGEHAIEALVREVYEETGLVIAPANVIPIYAGVCEGVKEYWVTAYLIEVNGDVEINSPEPEMQPIWITKEDFMAQTSFPLFNRNVFAAIEAYWQ